MDVPLNVNSPSLRQIRATSRLKVRDESTDLRLRNKSLTPAAKKILVQLYTSTDRTANRHR